MTLFDQKTPYIYTVRSEFSEPEREADWNAWYNDFDIPAMLDLPGIESATRYQEVVSPRRYLAAYEIENRRFSRTPTTRSSPAGWSGRRTSASPAGPFTSSSRTLARLSDAYASLTGQIDGPLDRSVLSS